MKEAVAMINKDQIKIRKCTSKDADTIVFLGRKTFTDTFGAVNTEENMKMYLDDTFSVDKILIEMNEPGAVFFIAEVQSVPCGFAKVRTSHNPEELNGRKALEIERIYAVNDFIGKGIGAKLMKTCLDHARENQFEIVWLGVWEHNLFALDFYKKWEFELFGQHVFMLGTDAQTDLLMKRKV
jgi:diamine N-acetyltransferase